MDSMTRKELHAISKQEFCERFDVDDKAMFFEPFDTFKKGIVGVTWDGQHIIYDYEALAEVLVQDGIGTFEDAYEYLDVNTMGSLPSACASYKPVVMFNVLLED